MTETPTSEAVQTEDIVETAPVEETESPQTPALETAAAETVVEEAPPEKVYKDWREALADADTDELLKDPRIEGRIGQVADKRARDLAKQQRDAAEAERLRNLRKTDPLAFAQAVDEQESANDTAAEAAKREQEMLDRLMSPLNTHLQTTLPPEALTKLQGKSYTGPTHGDALQSYVDDIVSVRLEHEVAKARVQWEKNERPALKKQVLAEINGAEGASPSPVNTGRNAGASFNSGYEASTALYEGRIDINEFRRLTEAHPDWR